MGEDYGDTSPMSTAIGDTTPKNDSAVLAREIDALSLDEARAVLAFVQGVKARRPSGPL